MKVTLHRLVWKRENGKWEVELHKVEVDKTTTPDGVYYTFPEGMDRDVRRYFYLNPGERYVRASILLNTFPALEDIEGTFKNALHHSNSRVEGLSKQINEETAKGMQLAALRDREVVL